MKHCRKKLTTLLFSAGRPKTASQATAGAKSTTLQTSKLANKSGNDGSDPVSGGNSSPAAQG